MRDYDSREFFINHPIRNFVSYVNKADAAKKRQNASQPIRWLETAADKAKFTQVTAVLIFSTKALHEYL